MRKLFAVFGLLAFLAVQPLAAQTLLTDAPLEPVDGTVVGLYAGGWLSSPTTPAFTMFSADFESSLLGGSEGDAVDFQNPNFMTPTGLNETGAFVPLSQDFLVQTAVVPEPQTYILLLSGLVAIFFVARRRTKENGYA